MTSSFYPSLFLFLAAGAVSMAAFGSVTTWVTARSKERESHERFALLRLLAEQPTENARLAIDELRGYEARRAERKRREQFLGGYVLIGVGVGLGLFMAVVAGIHSGVWTIGAMLVLIGIALLAGSRRPAS